MNNFPPNINWRYATLIATVLGYAASGDFTAREQIAIGNWILQIGQTLLTNATYQEMIENRIIGEKVNLNSREFKCGGSPFITPQTIPPDFRQFYESFKSQFPEEELANLQEAIDRINEELKKIREEFKK